MAGAGTEAPVRSARRSNMFYTKAQLEKEIKAAGQKLVDALVVSVDLPERNSRDTFKGKKGFYFCRDTAEYLARLQDGEHLHEVLPDKYETRCFVYMDIDEACDGDEAVKEQKTVAYVRKVLDAFVLTPKDVGNSVQVLTSHAPHKLSIHVVIYIESFPAEVEVRMDRVDKSVPWDPSVYSMFRSYRTAYHRKGGKAYRLRPWGNSSVKMEDHLVRILPDDLRQPVRKLPSINIPREKKEKLQKKRKAPRGDDDPCRQEIMEVLAETNLLEVIGATSFDEVLGVSTKKDGCMLAYINNGHTCPIKKASHSSNRGYVRVSNGEVTYHCLAPACKSEWVSIPKLVGAPRDPTTQRPNVPGENEKKKKPRNDNPKTKRALKKKTIKQIIHNCLNAVMTP